MHALTKKHFLVVLMPTCAFVTECLIARICSNMHRFRLQGWGAERLSWDC